MTRCDYDTVFYRVFCVTLLAIAFTFTVILTNVFVDIDGLLASKKDKLNVNTIPNVFTKLTTEPSDNDETNYSESDDSYRTKRSIETQSYLFHIKNPKVKNILANRLSTLLEELEAEESIDVKPKERKTTVSRPKVVDKSKSTEEEKKHNDLHSRLHNIIMQGIATHMDLNNVFKTIQSLMPTLKDDLKEEPTLRSIEIGGRLEGENDPPKMPLEDKFLDEMLNCHELHKQILHSSTTTTTTKPLEGPPKVMIKTVIDVLSVRNDKENDTKISKENIEGDIELIYNGKVIKFTRSDIKTGKPSPQKKSSDIFKLNPFKPKQNPVTMETTTEQPRNDYNIIPKSYMDKFVEEYFKHFPHDSKDLNNDNINQHFETKRLKRHVRIKYENENSGEAKKSHKKNTEEDELYVEIETHFDSKGMKGEKKKKIVKNLIEKIQKAIHSDMTNKLAASTKNNTRHHKRIHFRKRVQNPLKHGNLELFNRYNSPLVHRQLHPISKLVHNLDPNPPFIDTRTEERKKPNFGPEFQTDGKNENSADIGEVDINYSKILEVNGIPQRLQQPLNTELSEETIKTNSYYDIGNSKYVIKDIDGSGFSVGFNQYVDNPPDPEAMRIFAGLENMIKSYHQIYDPTPTSGVTTETNDVVDDEEVSIENSPYNERLNEHTIERRSINKNHDYHSNEYKIIFDKNAMPYDSYHDIYNTELKKSTPIRENKLPLILDEKIFERNLKPSEILSLANLFQRKKRSVNYKKTLTKNLNHKTVNRFLNTNAMSTKTIFLNRKRNKRQINKIRIIATDMPENYRHSDENVFVVSGENIFADRAMMKDAEALDIDHDKHEEPEPAPYQNNESESYITKILKRRSRQNPLMSKYPHVFMEEVSRSGEEFHFPNNVLLPGFGKPNPDDKIDIEQQFMTSSTNDTELLKQLQDQELFNTSVGSPTNSNYKVTVKIIPKNESDLHSGFKEMHTTINKSFNKNGLLYSSLVNVSEISKVMNLSSTRGEEKRENVDKEFGKEESFLSKKIYDQQEKMQFLLKEHAKHISDQLNRLQEEKMNLEYILNTDNNTAIKIYKNANMPLQSYAKVANVQEEPTAQQAIEEIQEVLTPVLDKQSRKAFSLNTIQVTTEAPDTQQPTISNRVQENDIISTIERNGNLTDQILKKIDRNTAILQMFLNKLTERIDPQLTTSQPERDDSTPPPDWRNPGIQFPHNMVIRKNDSHISIPFNYAYQTPTSIIPAKGKSQLANVIYQGHIRNFNVHNGNQHAIDNGMINKISESNNQSRFFIDGLENDYKVIQLGEFKKNRDYNNNVIPVNGSLS